MCRVSGDAEQVLTSTAADTEILHHTDIYVCSTEFCLKHSAAEALSKHTEDYAVGKFYTNKMLLVLCIACYVRCVNQLTVLAVRLFSINIYFLILKSKYNNFFQNLLRKMKKISVCLSGV